MDGDLGAWQQMRSSGSLLRLTGQQRMGYKTIETREGADDAELGNVTQMTDQWLETSKE